MSPEASSLPRNERKAIQRQNILEAAREVFFRDGFMDANLDEMAQRAGIAKGTLYRYFENKAELYVAVLSENAEAFFHLLQEALAAGETPADRIRSLGRFYLEHWTRNPGYFQIFWALENQPVIGALPAQAVVEVTRLWRRCLEEVSRVIDEGIAEGHFAPSDSWTVANLLWSSANALIRGEEVAPRRELRGRTLEESFHQMVELYLRGLRVRG